MGIRGKNLWARQEYEYFEDDISLERRIARTQGRSNIISCAEWAEWAVLAVWAVCLVVIQQISTELGVAPDKFQESVLVSVVTTLGYVTRVGQFQESITTKRSAHKPCCTNRIPACVHGG